MKATKIKLGILIQFSQVSFSIICLTLAYTFPESILDVSYLKR